MADADLNITPKQKMHTARFDTPLALVYGKYILAFGGKTSKYHGTKRCEVFDTKGEQWLHLAPMPFFCVNTSAVVIQKRYVYLMPGHNRETQTQGALMIGYLDTGALEKGVEGIPSIQWNKLIVRNLDFVNSCPTAGFALQ